jgi:hypothetical protein
MRPRFTRRTFLAGLAAGIAGAALGLHLHRGAAPVAGEAERLTALLRHANSAALLGRVYLDGAPQEADPARLVKLIGAAPDPALPAGDAGGEEALRKRVAERIRADFLNDNTIAVGGWLVALTEARLCALVSLLRDAKPRAGA